jgi:protein TonB
MRPIGLFLTAVVLFAASVSAQQEVFTPGNGVTSPVVTKLAKPRYTEGGRAAGIEGWVSMEVVIRADGTVGDVTVTRSLDTTYGLDDEAVSAIRQCEFKPGTKDGKPVAVRVNWDVRFHL